MVARQSTCLRRLSAGDRAWEVGFGRFLANENVTVERLIAGWSEQTASAVAGRHVIAIQDTSDINFRTTAERRRGLGQRHGPRRAGACDGGGRRRQRGLSRAGGRLGLHAKGPGRSPARQTKAGGQGIPPLDRYGRRGQDAVGASRL